jgi:hypothetical protein
MRTPEIRDRNPVFYMINNDSVVKKVAIFYGEPGKGPASFEKASGRGRSSTPEKQG